MKLKHILTGAAVGLGLAGAVAAQESDPFKVGFIYVGPIGDGGYSYQHEQGRLAAQDHFGDAIETVYVESVPEGPDAVRVMQQMALNGADMIFATSFGFQDQVVQVAEQFPNVLFEHATGFRRADNLATYSARFYEGRAVEGHIAGLMTKSDIVGYIGSYPIPEVLRGINSAFLHARQVNPDVEFRIVWTNSWFNPAQEAEAARALIDQGADVILQHIDSTAPQAVAAQAGNVITFGQASDMAEFAPMPRVSSIIDNWAPYYIARIEAGMDGTWQSADTWGGIGSGMVKIGEISEAVPPEVKQSAEALRDRIASGEYHPFTGPINRQDGSTWLEEGETPSDEDLLSMNFYVEGIVGDIPR